MTDETSTTALGAIERLGSGAVSEAERIGGDVAGEAKAVVTDVIAEAKTIIGAGKVDALALIASLGGIHTSLGSFTLSDEIAAARTAVEQAIVSIAKHFAQVA